MIKHLFSLLLLCILQQNCYAQNKDIDARAASIPDINCANVDALASYIKQNFATDTDRLRAIYIWITHHIDYDIASFLDREKNDGSTPPQAVADVISSRKAVCHGYADLFITLCRGVGINAILIPGYTRKDGKVSTIPHAWAAAALGDDWYLFDPTWGAGYVQDERKFVRRFNSSFYKVQPGTFIADHMPFDPLYQFLSNPLTHKEFIDGKQAANKILFHYNDSLKQFALLSPVEQNAAELRRLEAAGVQNDLLQQRQLFLKNRLQSFASKNTYDEGGKIFKAVISTYNEYVAHKNKQFSTIGDNDLRQMVDSMEQNVKLSRSLVSKTVTKTDAQSQAKINSLANMDRFWVQLDKEKQFLKQYFSTDKEARKQLFTKRGLN
jgi:hypothetical protein